MKSVLAAVAVLVATTARAEVRVGALIGDHMVVQRRRPVRLWGTAAAGETVRASLAGGNATTQADARGRWQLTLPALEAGGPYVVTVQGTNTLTFSDVWAGEVWVASGQSNMEFPLTQADPGADAAAATCPGLRLFTVAKATAAEPRDDVTGQWEACDSSTAPGFSAVAFHFGQELQRALGVTVGLVHSSWGGTPAEAWTPRGALAADPRLKPMLDAFDRARADPGLRAEAARKLEEWEARNFHRDTGNLGEGQGWAALDAATAGWSKMDLPQPWENAGLKIDGVLWFRRDVEVPAAWAGRDLVLALGPIDDMDTTYWSGERIGSTGQETPQYWAAPRRYTVPGRLVKAGRAVVAVRAFDHFGNGGFTGAAPQMKLAPATGGGTPLPLAGTWDYRIERSLEPAVADFSTRPEVLDADNPNSPTVLWNAMMGPLTRFAVGGAIWYQGESNASRAYQYRTLFPVMIRAWREAWGPPDLPFLFVQLPNFNPLPVSPGESDWAELREAQALALGLPHTGMAVTLDIGEAGELHPRNKKDVGRRLARVALKNVYGQDVIASGPAFKSFALEGAAIRVRFDAAGGLVTADGGAPRGFAVAGVDRLWHWADARIDGDSVIVSSPSVAEPLAVRYGWADNPPNTLRNQAGLPAAPFRSDDWPGTEGR